MRVGDVDAALGRLLSAVAFGLICVGVALGVEALLLRDPALAMPSLTRIGFALQVARAAQGWLRKRAARQEGPR